MYYLVFDVIYTLASNAQIQTKYWVIFTLITCLTSQLKLEDHNIQSIQYSDLYSI